MHYVRQLRAALLTGIAAVFAIPQSFNPASILYELLRDIRVKQKLENAYTMLAPKDAVQN